MSAQPYVPLHIHSEYSLLDGAIRINDLVNFAKENGMPAVALTDHGVMYGDMELYTTAKENGVKPIVGCEFYVHDTTPAITLFCLQKTKKAIKT